MAVGKDKKEKGAVRDSREKGYGMGRGRSGSESGTFWLCPVFIACGVN